MKRLFHRKDKNKSSSEQGSSAGATPPTAQYPSPGVTPPPAAVPLNAQPPPGMVTVQGQQGATYVPRPPRVQDVGNAIGWSVAMTAFDFGYLLELADYLASSASASKEAAKALTKEFKVSSGRNVGLTRDRSGGHYRRRSRDDCLHFHHPEADMAPFLQHAMPPAQERAVRLTGILFRNTDTRFRRTSQSLLPLSAVNGTTSPDDVAVQIVERYLHRTEQVAQKKFLAALTGLVSSPTSTPSVKLMVFRVLSPLAYETRHDSDLSSITHAYDALLADPKTRPTPETVGEEGYDPALFPPHGAPLDPEDPLLRPEALLSSGGGGRSSRSQRPRPERFPTGLEQMQDLRKRAVEGRGYAAMLTDAVNHAEEEEEKERRRRSAQGLPPVVVQQAAAGSGDDEDGHEREVRTGLEANEVVQVRARVDSFSL